MSFTHEAINAVQSIQENIDKRLNQDNSVQLIEKALSSKYLSADESLEIGRRFEARGRLESSRLYRKISKQVPHVSTTLSRVLELNKNLWSDLVLAMLSSGSEVNQQAARNQLFYSLIDQNIDRHNLSLETIKRSIQRVGLSPDDLISSWELSPRKDYRPGGVYESFLENLKALNQLANRKPDAPRVLEELYGIRSFGRYPQRFLLNQYRQSRRKDQPTSIWIHSAGDWSGSFYNSSYTKNNILDTLGKSVFAVEAASVTEINQRLEKIAETNPKMNRPDCLIVTAHGNKNTVCLLDGRITTCNHQNCLTSSTLENSGISFFEDFFANKPTVILDSCQTGAINGFAQRLSARYGLTVYAPDISTSLGGVYLPRKFFGPKTLKVEDRDGHVLEKYVSGVVISRW